MVEMSVMTDSLWSLPRWENEEDNNQYLQNLRVGMQPATSRRLP